MRPNAEISAIASPSSPRPDRHRPAALEVVPEPIGAVDDGGRRNVEARVAGRAADQVVVQKRTFVQDRPVAYSVAGAGMPVVLLHGWGLADHTYRDVIARIASQNCRVIAPSMPGFGGTHELPREQFSIAGYGHWVADLLKALDVDEPAVVVGHSFGGGVAIRLAHDHPHLVRSMVLVNSIGGSSWRKGSVMRSIAERPFNE